MSGFSGRIFRNHIGDESGRTETISYGWVALGGGWAGRLSLLSETQ